MNRPIITYVICRLINQITKRQTADTKTRCYLEQNERNKESDLTSHSFSKVEGHSETDGQRKLDRISLNVIIRMADFIIIH